MRERVEKLLGGVETPQISTFHATCVRILRREIGRLGFGSNFAIYDDKESERLLKEVIIEQNIDEKKYPAKAFAAAIDDCKNAGRSPMISRPATRWRSGLSRVYSGLPGAAEKMQCPRFRRSDPLHRQALRRVPGSAAAVPRKVAVAAG